MKKTIIPLFAFLEQVRKSPQKQSVEERIRHFARIYTQYNQAQAKNQTERCLDCGNPYCQWKCPVHNYIPGWLRLVAEGKIMEAADLAHKTNTLPEVCGLVCPQESLCEGACTLNGELGAVTIGAIENYLAETALDKGWKPDLSQVIKNDYKVAIIGAGPAGLACADRLIHHGVAVTVYDKHPEIGGLLTFGIPEFKLEKRIMLRRRKIFEDMGIQFKLNSSINQSAQVYKLLKDYDALFLGLGADKGIQAHIPGENLPEVLPALPFLINQINSSLNFKNTISPNLKGKRVIVLGAGDTAIDCSRTAIRLGASKVQCVYRRGEEDRHGAKKDYKLAKEEGVEFLWWRQALAFHGEESLAFVEFSSTKIDSQGNLKTHGKKEFLKADIVIIAYGFEANPPHWFSKLGIKTHKNGLVNAQENSLYPLQTTNEKIFAGGDIILGANLVVNAIAQGHMAAKSIFSWISRV